MNGPSLAEKEGLKGQVQCIYIDPPYGIKFGSNWQVSTLKRDVKDGKPEEATRQPEQVKAFRDTWELGVHSYLSYLRDRLMVARELLTESGSCFVQIGDENVHLVRCLMDEVFGSENFQSQINFKSTSPLGQKGLPKAYDYIIWYSKDKLSSKFRPIYQDKNIAEDKEYRFEEKLPSPIYINKLKEEDFQRLDNHAKIFRRQKLTSSGFTKTCTYEFDLFGQKCKPFGGKSWATNIEGMKRVIKANRLFLLGNSPYYKRYYQDAKITQFDNT